MYMFAHTCHPQGISTVASIWVRDFAEVHIAQRDKRNLSIPEEKFLAHKPSTSLHAHGNARKMARAGLTQVVCRRCCQLYSHLTRGCAISRAVLLRIDAGSFHILVYNRIKQSHPQGTHVHSTPDAPVCVCVCVSTTSTSACHRGYTTCWL